MTKRLSFLVLILVPIAAGCATAREGIGDNVTAAKIVNLVPGKTTRAQVRLIFGQPDIVKQLGGGAEEYTYLQSKDEAVSWLILSGYLIYHPTTGFSGNRILVIQFEGDTVARFIASDGRLTLKKGYGEEAQDADPGKPQAKPEGENQR